MFLCLQPWVDLNIICIDENDSIIPNASVHLSDGTTTVALNTGSTGEDLVIEDELVNGDVLTAECSKANYRTNQSNITMEGAGTVQERVQIKVEKN